MTEYTVRENEIRSWAFHSLDTERGKQTAALTTMERLLGEGLQALQRGRIPVTEERLEIVLEMVTKELSRIRTAEERSRELR